MLNVTRGTFDAEGVIIFWASNHVATTPIDNIVSNIKSREMDESTRNQDSLPAAIP